MKTIDIPKVSRRSILKSVMQLIETGARQAVVYQHPRLSVKSTRLMKPNKRDHSVTVVLTIGKPNYEGRKFVQECLRAGETFPLRKTQFRWYPEKAKHD